MASNAALLRREQPQSDLDVEVVERKDAPGIWTVEAIGPDGEIYQAMFPGPDSKGRALEYARMKYGV